MKEETLTIIKEYIDKKNDLKNETYKYMKKINKLKRKIERRKTKIKEINLILYKTCSHVWVPNFAEYNVYDRPKYCKICGIDKNI